MPRMNPNRRTPAVAAAAALGAAARGREAASDVPDHPRDPARSAAGRLRRALRCCASPAASPIGASAWSRRPRPQPSPYRPRPALRVRRRVHVRGRLAARRTPRGRALGRPRAAGRTARARSRCASCSTPRSSRSSSARRSGSTPTAAPAASRVSRTCCACSVRWTPPRSPRASTSESALDLPRVPRSPRECPRSRNDRTPRNEADGIRAHLDALIDTRRAIPVTIAGRRAGRGDRGRRPAARCARRGAARRHPERVPRAARRPARRPGRPVRPHARPVHDAIAVAERLGIGVAVARHTLQRLEAQGRLTSGFFLPVGRPGTSDETEWCDTEVLRRLRMRSLAAIRGSVEPVSPEAFARFLPGVAAHRTPARRASTGWSAVIEQLAGVPIPASAWESLVLPSRVRDYTPAMLDELTATGEVIWSGHGALPGRDGWIALHPADAAPLTLPPPEDEHRAPGRSRRGSLDRPRGRRRLLRRPAAADAAEAENEQSVVEALWSLTWSGRVTNDTFAPIRTLLGGRLAGARTARKAPRARDCTAGHRSRRDEPHRRGRPRSADAGRCCRRAEPDAALRATAAGEPAARPLRRRHARFRAGRGSAGRLRAGLPGARRLRAGRALPARVRDREARARRSSRHPPRSTGCASSRGSPTRAPLRGVHPRRDRPREPLRRRARLARARGGHAPPRTQGRRARRARRRRPRAVPRARGQDRARRSRTTRRCSPPPRRTSPPRRARGASTPSRSSRSTVSSSTAPPSAVALRDAGFVESPRGLTLRRATAGDALREPARAETGLSAVPEGDTVYRAAQRLDDALAGTVRDPVRAARAAGAPRSI